MPWRMIFVRTADRVVDFADTPLQSNFMHLIYESVDFYMRTFGENHPQSASYALTLSTFRNASKCNIHHPMYVISSSPKTQDNPNMLFVNCVHDIPHNEYVNVWFVGSRAVRRLWLDLMDEIHEVKICTNTRLLWPNLNHQSQMFVPPKNLFEQKETFFNKSIFIDCLGKEAVICATRFTKQNTVRSKQNIDTTSLMQSNSAMRIRFLIGHTENIPCQRGFPVFHLNLEYQARVIDDTFFFLNGAALETNFCKHYSLVRGPEYAAAAELDAQTISSINRDNVQANFVSILDAICADANFVYSLNCNTSIFVDPLIPALRCNPLQIRLAFVPAPPGEILVSLVVWISECNLVDDYPYLVISACSILFAITHYISRHCIYPSIFRAERVTLQFGRLFYHYEQEVFVRSHRLCPIQMTDSCKAFLDYNSTDFGVFL